MVFGDEAIDRFGEFAGEVGTFLGGAESDDGVHGERREMFAGFASDLV